MRRARGFLQMFTSSVPDILTSCVVWSLIFVQSTIINFRYRDKNYATLTMSLGPGAMMMGRCLQVTSGFTISAEPPLSLFLSPPVVRDPGSPPRLPRSATISVPRPRGDRGQLDSCEGTPGGGRHRTWDPGPDQWCNYSEGPEGGFRGEQEKPVSKLEFRSSFWITVLLWTLSIIRREIWVSWTSCLSGNDESGLNLVMSIQWGKTRLGAGIWNSRMMSMELMREAIRLLISSYLHSLTGDQLWDLGPLSVTRDPGYQNLRISFPYFQVGALRDKMHSDWGNVSQDDVIENWLWTSWMSSGTIECVDISTLE